MPVSGLKHYQRKTSSAWHRISRCDASSLRGSVLSLVVSVSTSVLMVRGWMKSRRTWRKIRALAALERRAPVLVSSLGKIHRAGSDASLPAASRSHSAAVEVVDRHVTKSGPSDSWLPVLAPGVRSLELGLNHEVPTESENP